MPDADRTAEWLQNTRIHQESAEHALKVKDIDSWCLAAVVNVDSPRLLAAVEAVPGLAAKWETEVARLDALAELKPDPASRVEVSIRAQAFAECARELREVITAALTEKEAGDG